MSGSRIRLKHLVDPSSGRAFVLSLAGGLSVGPIGQLADLEKGAFPLVNEHVTGIVLNKGVVKHLHEKLSETRDVGLIVDLFGSTLVSLDPNDRQVICSVEHAVSIGAEAVLAHVDIGVQAEGRLLQECAMQVEQAEAWGMPLIVNMDTTQTDAHKQFSGVLVAHAARLAQEMGAGAVAIPYVGPQEDFREAISGIKIPALINGGSHVGTPQGMLRTVSDALGAGAAGVLFGPAFLGTKSPNVVSKVLGEMIMGGKSLQEAKDLHPLTE